MNDYMLRIIVLSACFIFLLPHIKANDSTNSAFPTYRPFIEDGKSWVITSSVSHGCMPVFQVDTYYIEGDTIVNDVLCKKLMLRSNNYANHTISCALNKLIFEHERKVFCFPLDDVGIASQDSVLMYDFGAAINDTLRLNGISNLPDNVTKCFQIWGTLQLEYNSELLHGQLATMYSPDLAESEVFNNHDYPLYHWYQAIGSTHHPFIKTAWNKNYTGMLHLLRDCRVGDRIIYQNWQDGTLFPDFTGDGDIDIADVNEAISVMLGERAFTNEVTGDGVIDIADVNAVINAMLRK